MLEGVTSILRQCSHQKFEHREDDEHRENTVLQLDAHVKPPLLVQKVVIWSDRQLGEHLEEKSWE